MTWNFLPAKGSAGESWWVLKTPLLKSSAGKLLITDDCNS
jgi:hypothetical protein